MYKQNFLFSTDSYKCSHHLLYPPETNYMFAYLESRVDSLFDRTVFFGGQALLNEYLTHQVTKEEVEEAKEFYAKHGVPFPYEGWMKVVTKYNGYLPVRIRMPLEGTVIPISNALATVESMDPELYWLVTWIETFFLRGLWYPITVSTVSWHCKKIILEHLLATSDDPYEQVKFKLHDFGARGVSSGESAGIGGMAHLVNFYGSDTVEGIAYANHFYHEDMAAFSIPASEHSTIISWGKDHEADAYENMLDRFGKGAIFACVSDSYDIYNAVEHIWGEKLREKVLASNAVLVVRPDSGDPKTVVVKTLQILADKFGFTTNSKGYKVLNHVRLIQGDGVEYDSLREVCEHVKKHGFSIDNIAFGMGGGLLQKLDRDTQRFAYKVSSVKVGDEYRIVQKSPATDMTKASKGGLLILTKNAQGEYKTETLSPAEYSHAKENGKAMPKNLLEVVYEGGGKILRDDTLAAIRERTLSELKLAISKETA
jgi:nicotinamide phosphoribosyltransferase